MILGAGAAYAGMTADPAAMPKQGRLAVDIDGAWAFEQNYKDHNATVSSGAAIYPVAVKDAKISDDHACLAGIAYGVSDDFSLFAKAGVAHGGTFKFSSWDASSASWWDNKFKLKDVFSWAVGARLRAFESRGGLGLMLAAQYQRYDDRKSGDMEYPGPGVSRNDFQVDFWRADMTAVLYQKLGQFTPYLGLGYEYSELKIAGRANLGTAWANYIDFGDMHNTDSGSVMVGLAWRATDSLSLSLQGQFMAQTALQLGANWAF